MNKISYMGDGETTEFFFDFPYFEDSNIIVTQNNIKITNFTVLGTRGGTNADIPFIGGKVVLEFAPSATDCITITRKLSLERTVDYQPTAKIDPSTLNQDMNYTMEVLKDFQNDLTDFKTLNGDPTATQELLLKIDAVSQQISALGNITQIRDNISTLDTRTNGILDYVIETQAPTAENNYTWYRKYKSGWVEQGGHVNVDINLSAYQAQGPINITLPVAINLVNGIANAGGDSGVFAADVYSISGTKFACFVQNCASRDATFNATIRFVVWGQAI